MRLPPAKKWLYEIFLVVFLLLAVFWWQTRHLLPRHTSVTDAIGELPETSFVYLETGESWSPNPASEKSVVLYFFAPWCQVCKWTINNLSFIERSSWWSDRAKVYAVALDFSDDKEVQRFKRDYDVEIPILLANEDVRRAFLVNAYPTYYFLGSNWKVASKSVGYTTRFGVAARVFFSTVGGS